MMLGLAWTCGALVSTVSAFQISNPHHSVYRRRRVGLLHASIPTEAAPTVNLDSSAQRDVFSMEDWARNCGVQTAEGFALNTQDGYDWFVTTSQDIPAGSPVLYVPSQIILSSSAAEDEFGGYLEASESALKEYDGNIDRLPLFRLMVKILSEYELGTESSYFPWLNSLPRWFSNGVAMTDACFECLPPYVSWLSKKERDTFSQFVDALRKGYAPLEQETIDDDDLIRWAYNVALTRHNVVVEGKEKKITPMADMFNHAAYPNVEINYDGEGNCVVTTTDNVPAGSPLTISLGDPTDPSPLFATYGFLAFDASSIFCKAIHMQDEMNELGYDFGDLLFSTETGEMTPQVWDLFLFNLLCANGENDLASDFLRACSYNDEGKKEGYHQQYFPYTLQALKEHVLGILATVDSLNSKANSYDVNAHPRVPFIVAHNDLVKSTFLKVISRLNVMG